MVKGLGIHPPNMLILDSMTFCAGFSKASAEGDRPIGPMFAYGAAKTVLSVNGTEQLVTADIKNDYQIEIGRTSRRIRIYKCLSNLANSNQMDEG